MKERNMELDDEELIVLKEKKELKKLIEACDKCSWRVTFYGKDREIVKNALLCYEAIGKQIEEVEKNLDLSGAEPEYWEKENYHLGKIKKLYKGEVEGL